MDSEETKAINHVEELLSDKAAKTAEHLTLFFSNNSETGQILHEFDSSLEQTIEELEDAKNSESKKSIAEQQDAVTRLESLSKVVARLDESISYSFLPEERSESIRNELKDLQVSLNASAAELNDILYEESGRTSIDSVKKDFKSIESSLSNKWADFNEDMMLKLSEEIREKAILDALRSLSNEEGVANTSLLMFSEKAMAHYRSKVGLSNEVDLQKGKWQRSADNLRKKGYQDSIDIVYGQNRNELDLTVSSADPEKARRYLHQKMDEAVNKSEKEIQQVNQMLRKLQEIKNHVKDSELITYSSSTDTIEKRAHYYAREMTNIISNQLNLRIDFKPEKLRIKKGKATGYMGKKKEIHRIELMKNPSSHAELYETEYESRREKLENIPTGAEGNNATVPGKAPDILVIDLIHELGHFITNLILESKLRQQDKNIPEIYGQEFTTKHLEGNLSEKAANEVAGFCMYGFKSSQPSKWEPIIEGFEAYLELTEYDNPQAGYVGQNIQATRTSLKKLFN